MKRLAALAALPLFALPMAPAMARNSQTGWSQQCFEDVYREEYIPGTASNPGRVRRWTETKEVPCSYGGGSTVIHEEPFPSRPPTRHVDDNSCVEGSIIGGISGAGIGAALSQGDGRWWAIPAGIVGGTMIGCQLDGG
jgi:hypothetical protein